MKKLIVLMMLLFSMFSVQAETIDLVTTDDTLITEVDSTSDDSVVDSLIVFDVDAVKGEPVPMRTSYDSIVKNRDSQLLYKKIVNLNFRDGQYYFPGYYNSTILAYNTTIKDTDTRVLMRSPFSGFKRHNKASGILL